MIILDDNLNAFGVMTFATFDYLLETDFKEKIEGSFNMIKYKDLKSKFSLKSEISLNEYGSLDLENVNIFLELVDFVSKLYLSDKSAYLKTFLAEQDGMTLEDFELFIIEYLKLSSEFFIYFKEIFKDESQLLETINEYLIWTTKI
jgi:hypothetical protein